MELNICSRGKLSLAFTYASDKEEAVKMLNAFLNEFNVENAKRYFLNVVVTQGSRRTVTYMEYAEVPEGLSKKGNVFVSSLREGQELQVYANSEEFEGYLEGKGHEIIQSFIKEQKLSYDLSAVYPYVEEVDGGYLIHVPVK